MNKYSKTISHIIFSLAMCVSISTYAEGFSKSNLLPDSAVERLAALNEQFNIDTSWHKARNEAIARAIDPGDYICDANTDFNVWLGETVSEIDPGTLFLLDFFSALDWPAYYSLLFDNDASNDYIGVNGEYTRELIKRHRDNQLFWDVPTDDILLLGMHGAIISDDSKMVPFVQFFFGIPDPAFAQIIVDVVQGLIEGGEVDLSPFGGSVYLAPGVPGGYDNPLFTLNAFAFSDEGVEIIPGFGLLPDKLVMGEGVLEAYGDIGLGTNAPDFIHAHEFAHHVQYELETFGPNEPEETRRTELMADAFGAYYSSHARGAAFQVKRFSDVMTAAYEIGDCSFTSPGHHGTPNQRETAAMWGGSVASSARKQGYINPAELMLDLFEAELPYLVAPDAD